MHSVLAAAKCFAAAEVPLFTREIVKSLSAATAAAFLVRCMHAH